MNSMNWLIVVLLAALVLMILGLRLRAQKSSRKTKPLPESTALASFADADGIPEQEQAEPASMAPDLAVPEDAKKNVLDSPLNPAEQSESVLTPAADPHPEVAAPGADPAVILLREVFDARQNALAATCRLQLESSSNKQENAAARELAEKQVRIMDERTAQPDASYKEECACHEETARFLRRLAKNNHSEQAAQIRQNLLHSASPKEAEDFLDQFSLDTSNRPTLAAQAAFLSGRLAERRVDLVLALERYSRALRIAPDNSEYLSNAAHLAHTLGQYSTAAKWQESMVRLMGRQPGCTAVDIALAQRDLAYTYLQAKHFEKAAPLYKTAMATLSEALGNNHPEMASGWFQLGEMQENQGAYDKAQTLYRRAIDILESNLGRLDPHLIPVLDKLARLSMDTGQEKEAASHYLHLLAILEKYLPADHPQLAATLTGLARACRLRGEYAQAEQYCQKSLQINESLHGREHPVIVAQLKELSLLYGKQGRLEQAQRYLEEAEAIEEKLPRQEEGTATVQQDAPLAERSSLTLNTER